MAEYPPPLNQSPFFRTFAAHRKGNVPQNRRHLPQQGSKDGAAESGSLQHYPILPGVLTRGKPSQRQQEMPPQRSPMIPNMSPPMPPTTPHQPPMNQNMMQPRGPQGTMSSMQQMTHPMSQIMIPQAPPPMQQALEQPGPQSPPPQSAAERFQQVNRGLPDGVRFEPIDAETKAALQKLGMAAPQTPPTPPASTPTPATAPAIPPNATPMTMPTTPFPPMSTPTMPLPSGPIPTAAPPLSARAEPSTNPNAPPMSSPESAAMLERLIQDERNASIFYQYLSGIAPTGDFQEALRGIAKDCENHTTQLRQILQNLHGRAFEPKNTPINTGVGFDQGVEMAVIEERKVLEAMANLIDQLADNNSSYAMQNLLNKRMIRLNWLQWAMFQQK